MTPAFRAAYAATMSHEGGYVNDPDDRGGETYCGISRRFHPSWPGWLTIDRLKHSGHFPANLKGHVELEEFKLQFYYEMYWLRCSGDRLPQVIATELFDTAVNTGASTASMFLQQALNKLNRNQQLFNDLKVDGWPGDATVAAVDVIEKQREIVLLYKVMNIYQGHHYLAIMENSPTQEKYARGWLSRVEFIKH